MQTLRANQVTIDYLMATECEPLPPTRLIFFYLLFSV